MAGPLVFAGLWISLHYCLVAFKADPDMFVTVALWRGVREHGLSFLRTWTYTQDNWILSLLPISSLFYSAIGGTPRIAALTGWLFFITSVALTAWLVARLAGRRAAVMAGCALLFANYHALGHIGFLGYPISHNVSMTWGLAVLLLSVSALERRAYWLCVAAGAVLFIDAVSDPWASAAIGGPLIIASGALAAANRRTRLGGCAVALCLAATVALWIAYKHPFGLLHFLPIGHFQLGGLHAIGVNLGFGYRALAVMFNILPAANLDLPRTQAISLAALALLVGGSAALTLLGLGRAGAGRQLIGMVAILSIGGVTALYLLGPASSGLYVGRFFANIYFLGALLVAITAAHRWRTWPWIVKGGVAAYTALFIGSGVMMAPQFWTAPLPASEPAQAKSLGQFLAAHKLTYGYGPYWGATSLAMDSLTQGAVTIRPVAFGADRIVPRPGGISSLWFAAGAEPAGASPFLVIRSDMEQCASLAACEATARKQFGPPAERLVHDDAIVLIWRRPLAPLLAAEAAPGPR